MQTKDIIAVIAAIIATFALAISFLEFKRSSKLFPAQVRPLVAVTPTGVTQLRGNQIEIGYSISNYSGFHAKNITINVRYEGYPWLNEWLKADADNSDGVLEEHFYESHPSIFKTTEVLKGESLTSRRQGEPDLRLPLNRKFAIAPKRKARINQASQCSFGRRGKARIGMYSHRSRNINCYAQRVRGVREGHLYSCL